MVAAICYTIVKELSVKSVKNNFRLSFLRWKKATGVFFLPHQWRVFQLTFSSSWMYSFDFSSSNFFLSLSLTAGCDGAKSARLSNTCELRLSFAFVVCSSRGTDSPARDAIIPLALFLQDMTWYFLKSVWICANDRNDNVTKTCHYSVFLPCFMMIFHLLHLCYGP